LRENTFFGDGIVAHISFADPFCPVLSASLAEAAQNTGARVHKGGTCVVMEGPAFSTKAESRLYRAWGASVIGMTALPEAKLAREAEICYAMLACATDYDVWHESEAGVSVELIVANLLKNVATSQQVLRDLVPQLPRTRNCGCASALRDAIITSRDRVTPEAKQRLAAIIGKYLD
jgi:5'-methylthioadenosine phosphorylase